MQWLLVTAMMLASPAQTAPQPPDLGWMVGNWATDTGANDQQAMERWVALDYGLDGAGDTRSYDVVRESETMRIRIVDGRAIYIADPSGQSEASFREVSRGPSEIVFENRDHDYPQRIRYRRDGERLLAEISLADGSKARQWRYCRVVGDMLLAKPCG